MLYLVYKTTNLINGKYYIGCHQTNKRDDGYLGSGVILKRAIEKYGSENFKREILFEAATQWEMFEKERELVDITDPNSYNMKRGGQGGWDYTNASKKNLYGRNGENGKKQLPNATRCFQEKMKNEDFRKKFSQSVSVALKKGYESGEIIKPFLGKQHTKETKQKIGQQNSIYQSGNLNSQFGTMWITNPATKQNRKIKKLDSIPEGWIKGRIL